MAFPFKRIPAGKTKEISESMQVMVWEDSGTDGKPGGGSGKIICPLGLRDE